IGLNTATPGTSSGQVSFATNDTDNNPFSFAVNGTVPPVYYLGDSDPGLSVTGQWLTYTNNGGYQQSYLEAGPGKGNQTATWSFTGLNPGEYQVATSWVPSSNRATNVPYA